MVPNIAVGLYCYTKKEKAVKQDSIRMYEMQMTNLQTYWTRENKKDVQSLIF